MRFAEDLSDRRAADAARDRIDWKYLLGLELTDPGSDASVLSEFRSRLVAGRAEEQLLDDRWPGPPPKALCTRSARRLLTPRRREEPAVLEAVRAREGEEGFAAAARYHRRAGIEGTLSAGVPALHLRCIRSVGLAKAHLQPVLTAAAMNVVCLDSSLGGEPFARVRHSPFARLMAQPACA